MDVHFFQLIKGRRFFKEHGFLQKTRIFVNYFFFQTTWILFAKGTDFFKGRVFLNILSKDVFFNIF